MLEKLLVAAPTFCKSNDLLEQGKHRSLSSTQRGNAHSWEKATSAYSLLIRENTGALAQPREYTENPTSKAAPEKLLAAAPTSCKSSDFLEQGKYRQTQVSKLHSENLQGLVPAHYHPFLWEGCWCPLPVYQGKHGCLGSTKRICRSSHQQSSTRKGAGTSPFPWEGCQCLLSDRAVGCPISEKHKIQEPCQWPCEGSHQWHSFHTKGARGSSLAHIPICRATESSPTSNKAVGGTPEIHILQCRESLGATIREKPPAPEALERDP